MLELVGNAIAVPGEPPTGMLRDPTGFVRIRGAREHNLKDVSLEVPRDALVVFTVVNLTPSNVTRPF